MTTIWTKNILAQPSERLNQSFLRKKVPETSGSRDSFLFRFLGCQELVQFSQQLVRVDSVDVAGLFDALAL